MTPNQKGNNREKSFSSSDSSFQAEGGNANIRTLNHNANISDTTSAKAAAKERVYYADWVRGMAILLVIFIHALVNSFDASGLEPDDVPTI